MRNFKILLIAITLSTILIFGCSSNQKVDEKKEKKTVIHKPTKTKPNSNGLISDDKEESTTTDIKDTETKKKPVYYKKKDDDKVEKNKAIYNDNKVKREISEINIAARTLNYEKAYSIYQEAKKIEPISDNCKEKLEKAGDEIRPYIEAFSAIYQKQYRDDLYVIFLKNAETFIGTIVEEDKKHGYIVMQNFSTNSYVTVKIKDIAEKKKMAYDQQKKMLKSEYDEAALEFLSEKQTPLNMLMLSKTAWRFGMKEEAYKYLTKALRLDEDYIRQTIALLEDSEYKKFMNLYRDDKMDHAHELLTKLINKYPKADLFKEAAHDVNEHVKEVERLREEEKRRIAAEIMAKRKAEEEAFRKQMEEQKRQEEKAKKEAEAKAREDKRKELAKLAEFDENSEAIKAKLQLPGPELLKEAHKEFQIALNFERESQPGKKDAERNLELAIYHYQFAKRLFQEAEKKGQDSIGMCVKINKALFWCRKRHTIR